MRYGKTTRGFALPTVVIASVILMMLLVGALSSVASVRRGISDQYYQMLAREAAESGIAMAKWCLDNNNGNVTWSAAQPLRPNTTCSGGAACTNTSSCFVYSDSEARTTFEVGLTTLQSGKTYTIRVNAMTQRLQSSTGAVWQQYPYTEHQEINLALSPITSGLVLNLDAGNTASYTSGNTVWNDLSGNGNNGTLVGTVGYSTSGGGALSFTGSGRVNIPDSPSLKTTGSMTLSFWMYPTNLAAGRQNIIDKAYGGEFSTTLEPAGWLTAYYGIAGAPTTPYQGWTISPSVQNKWQEVTIVRDLSSMKIYAYVNGTRAYINSTLSADLIASYANAVASSNPVTIGYGYTGVYYQGLIGSVKIYNRALSPLAVRQNYVSQRDRYNSASQTSCLSILKAGLSTGSGVYTINPTGVPFSVYCDMTTNGGGWTLVLQNNSAVATPSPTWNDSINTNTISGTIGTNLTAFDQLVGLNYWNAIGTQLRAQVGTTPTTISNSAMYNFYLDPTNSFSLNLSSENILAGGTQPGIFIEHNNKKWTTTDVDNDTNAGNCASYYGNHPWWYTTCWNGNFFAGGSGYQEAPYWVGSGTGYYAYGSIWLR